MAPASGKNGEPEKIRRGFLGRICVGSSAAVLGMRVVGFCCAVCVHVLFFVVVSVAPVSRRQSDSLVVLELAPPCKQEVASLREPPVIAAPPERTEPAAPTVSRDSVPPAPVPPPKEKLRSKSTPPKPRKDVGRHEDPSTAKAPATASRHDPPRRIPPPSRDSSSAVYISNESGQDALKHGAEARFMQGLATEEFVEENYVGSYKTTGGVWVWIEDDRARSGHLILHAGTGFRRPLFRFNRFIYVYGVSPDSPYPALGSVTFFSDGYRIHQFLWQHNGTQAYYPARMSP